MFKHWGNLFYIAAGNNKFYIWQLLACALHNLTGDIQTLSAPFPTHKADSQASGFSFAVDEIGIYRRVGRGCNLFRRCRVEVFKVAGNQCRIGQYLLYLIGEQFALFKIGPHMDSG